MLGFISLLLKVDFKRSKVTCTLQNYVVFSISLDFSQLF